MKPVQPETPSISFEKLRLVAMVHKGMFGVPATRRLIIAAGGQKLVEVPCVAYATLHATFENQIRSKMNDRVPAALRGEAEYTSWIERLKADADPGNLRLYADT